MSNLKALRDDSHGFNLLYVEDNEALRKNAAKLLHKIFKNVDTAENGMVGLELFKKYHHPIVITDIKMPKMDGMTFIKHIREISSDTKIIVMSAFDTKEYLLEGISLGLFCFLKKPVNVMDLTDTLQKAISEIKYERHQKMFYMHLQNVFNYQSSMVVMLHGSKIIIANDVFMEFFSRDDTKDIVEISANFLVHDGFLYNHDGVDVLQTMQQNSQKLFHIKLKDKDSKLRHFILKFQNIPEHDNYAVLSFDDVTELNLLKLFDEKQSNADTKLIDSESIFKLLKVIQRNSGKISIHNYYKGLSITNDGIITNIEANTLTLKTSYMQLKAIQIEQKFLIVSNALPYTILCEEIIKICFEKQEVEAQGIHFVVTSPITRKTIRVVPDEKHTISLFLGENKFHGDVEIEDISLDAIKLKMAALPAGLDKDSDITLDIVLELDRKPLIINTKAKLYRKSESKHSFHLVFIFEDFKKSGLVKYITKRQMTLIREIKGMQNG